MKHTSFFKCIRLMLITTLPITLHSQVEQTNTLLIVGDSLSASYNIPLERGWVELLAERIRQSHPKVKVVNASISGETTGNALKRLPELMKKHRPSYVVIELGGNDGLRGFKLSQIKKNLESMIQRIKAGGAQVVLTGIHIPPNYGPAYTKVFYDAYEQLSKTYQTEFVPFILENIGDRPELMQADGIHPTAEAQPKILENMWPHIEKVLRP